MHLRPLPTQDHMFHLGLKNFFSLSLSFFLFSFFLFRLIELKFMSQERKKFQLGSRNAYYLKILPAISTGSKNIMESPENVAE